MVELKTIIKGGSVYGLANSLVAGSQFLIVIVYASALSPELFGEFSIYVVLAIVFAITVGQGLAAAAQQSFFKLSAQDFRVLVCNIVGAMLLAALTFSLILILLPQSFISWVGIPRRSILLALGAGTAQALMLLVLTALQTTDHLLAYTRLVALQVILTLSTAGCFHILNEQALESAILLHAVPPTVSALVGLVLLARMRLISTIPSWRLLREGLLYSLPLVPHQLAGWVTSMLDRFIIVNSLGLTAAGVYSLSFQIAQGFNIVSNSFNQAIVPVLFRRLAQAQKLGISVGQLNRSYGAALLGSCVLYLIAFMVAAPFLISDEYAIANSLTPWLIVGFFLLSISRIASNIVLFYGRTGVLAMITVTGAVVSVVLNIYLVPRYGLVGACASSVTSFLIILLITGLQATRCYRKNQ